MQDIITITKYPGKFAGNYNREYEKTAAKLGNFILNLQFKI